MTYWAINAVFLAASVAVAVAASVLVARGRRTGVSWRSLLIALAVVLVMTAVFDNVMIGVGLVDYDPARISGAFVGIAPLEDFAYAVAGVILLPALWVILGKRMPRDSRRPRAEGSTGGAGATGGTGGAGATGGTGGASASLSGEGARR